MKPIIKKLMEASESMAHAQHTPGPWLCLNGEVLDDEPTSGWQVWPKADGVARIASIVDGIEAAANARLIAAAPELLAACKLFLPLATDAKCIQSVKWTTARDIARAAIAKAEGRAQNENA